MQHEGLNHKRLSSSHSHDNVIRLLAGKWTPTTVTASPVMETGPWKYPPSLQKFTLTTGPYMSSK